MKLNKIIVTCLMTLILLLLCVACTSHNAEQTSSGQSTSDTTAYTTATSLAYPWEKEGAKQPNEYTWEEYNALTEAQQVAFSEWFSTVEAFEDWLLIHQEEVDVEESMDLPWSREGAKKPDKYTWEEYEALTGDQQVAFYNWFLSPGEFSDWLKANQPEINIGNAQDLPWEKENAKQPDKYTWKEYEALTGDQQVAFYEWFSTAEDFDAWLKVNQPEISIGESQNMPWEKENAKQPDKYTWEEYEALTGDQQVAFYEWFSTSNDFDTWLAKNQPELDIEG